MKKGEKPITLDEAEFVRALSLNGAADKLRR
jgi:hypothetical protein